MSSMVKQRIGMMMARAGIGAVLLREATGVTTNLIAALRSGGDSPRRLNLDALMLIADALGVTVAEIVSDDPIPMWDEVRVREVRERAERLAAELAAATVDETSAIVDVPATIERVNLIAAGWQAGRRQELKRLIAAVVERVDVRTDGIRIYLKGVLRVGGNNISVSVDVNYR